LRGCRIPIHSQQEIPLARLKDVQLRRWLTWAAMVAAVAAIVLLVLMNRATAP
jgi:hypothetical protein